MVRGAMNCVIRSWWYKDDQQPRELYFLFFFLKWITCEASFVHRLLETFTHSRASGCPHKCLASQSRFDANRWCERRRRVHCFRAAPPSNCSFCCVQIVSGSDFSAAAFTTVAGRYFGCANSLLMDDHLAIGPFLMHSPCIFAQLSVCVACLLFAGLVN